MSVWETEERRLRTRAEKAEEERDEAIDLIENAYNDFSEIETESRIVPLERFLRQHGRLQ